MVEGEIVLGNHTLFCCQQDLCPDSCCGAYSGFSDKLNSVDGREFKDIVHTDEDALILQNSAFSHLIYQGQDGLYRILTDTDGYCAAYKSGKCLINDFKPTICKCFPLYLDMFVGICSHKDCPAANADYTLFDYENEVQSLIKMCEFWISHYRKLMNPGK